jgi:hypothetical protein
MDHRQGTAALLSILVLLFAVPNQGHGQMSQAGVTITATVPGAPTSGGGGGGGRGGGGGGGGSTVPKGKATVVFSGRAYPGSAVTILESSTRRGSSIAGSDATFSFTLQNVSPGNHTYALFSTDRNGIRSALQSFPISVTSDLITTVSGIFIAPTISVDKASVARGEPVTILGQTAPTGNVSITVNSSSALSFLTTADSAGIYAYTFLTNVLEDGRHEALARTSVAGAVSGLSSTATFRVGESAPDEGVAENDLNGDDRINIVDFSILAFWFKKSGPPEAVDLNGDGSVNLIDFSILAYHWTG